MLTADEEETIELYWDPPSAPLYISIDASADDWSSMVTAAVAAWNEELQFDLFRISSSPRHPGTVFYRVYGPAQENHPARMVWGADRDGCVLWCRVEVFVGADDESSWVAALHELGHVALLQHDTDTGGIMDDAITSDQVFKVTKEDIRRLTERYATSSFRM